LPSMAGFDAIPWHYEILFKRRKVFKSLFRRYSALRVACGTSKTLSKQARADRTSCAAALYAPSMALRPVADMILKTE